ncbi:MAG: DUF6077 domain-containing protein [Clostridiales bacterium]|nr:DUF6077 domain-containing protein [Clostridiales bacterium]
MTAIISLFFWLVMIPFCIGLVPACFISPVQRRRNPGVILLGGYFCMWALFGLVAIPAVLWVQYHNFSVASRCFTVLSILCAAAGLLMWRRKAGDYRPELTSPAREREEGIVKRFLHRTWAEKIEWLLFWALLGFQLYKAVAYTSFDGDDAYYVVESLIAQQADVMYRILPYTGGSTSLDVRHALAVFPMWVAFVAVQSGIHATIVSHVVMPVVLIPLTYLVYYEIGKGLFGEQTPGDGERLPLFMIVMCVFQIFGNVSIYTNETFFLTRTWQGKAVAGSLVIPAFLWLLLWIYQGAGKDKERDAGLWIILVCVNMTAGICSSIAVFIVSILLAVTALGLAFAQRDGRVLLRIGAACIPNVIYMGLYVMVAYGPALG